MGGGDTPTQPAAPAAPPSASETSAEAIQAQIDALPKILAAQQQYGGQFSQQQLDQLNQYGPQFAQSALALEQQFAPQYKAISDTLNPEIGAAQSYLSDYLNGQDNTQTGGVAPQDQSEYNSLMPGVLDQIRSAQSARGLGAISPLGSIDESVQLAQLKQSLKDRRLNIALSTAGRTPISGIANVQGTTGSGQLVNNVDPNSIFSYQQGLNNFNASIFGTAANIFGTQANAVTQARGQNISVLNAGIGAGAKILAG